jgi:hypothetical protein
LSRKKPKRRFEKPAEQLKTAAPFLERRSLVLALGLIAIAVIRIAAAWPEMSITFDEPAHLACGLQYGAQHVYLYEPQHPPLARAMAALGPYLGGARLLDAPNMILEGVAVLYYGGHTERTLTLARLGILPFFTLACLVVYFWARRYFGNPVAVVAIGLFPLLPSVLAHAGLATTDMALTACLGAATAMAVLSEFTALGFLPVAAVFALVVYMVTERPGWKRLAALAKQRAAPLAVAVLVGALVVRAGYLFSFGAAPGWSVRLPAPSFSMASAGPCATTPAKAAATCSAGSARLVGGTSFPRRWRSRRPSHSCSFWASAHGFAGPSAGRQLTGCPGLSLWESWRRP